MGEVLSRFKTQFSEYKLIPSGGGKFEVSVDGKLLYSKVETGNFPETKQVLRLLDKCL